MNIDEALIERIIREVVSQVVAEKAAGGGQNGPASGNNQNSMQSVNLGQIEQLVKNVASGDRQTSFGGQTSNAGGYHPEEPVHDVDIEEDITSREVKKRPLIDQPQDPEALERMMRLTTARIGVGCAGPRLKTQTLLTLRADHARARDAVMLDVHQDVIDNLKLFSVQTRCQDKNEFLTRPDLGRRLSEDGVQKVKDQCIEGPDVQLISSGAEAAKYARRCLEEQDLLTDRQTAGENTYYVSDSTEMFIENAGHFLHRNVVGKVFRCNF